MKKWIGKVFMAIGVLHTLLGVATFWPVIAEMGDRFFLNTVSRNHPERFGVMYFFVAGFMLILIGLVVDWAHRKQYSLPRGFVWGVLGVAAFGFLLMPRSGFLLLLIPAVALVLPGRK